jgi:hypothetical protein
MESKWSAAGKVALQFTAILPITIQNFEPRGPAIARYIPQEPLRLEAASSPVSVLRI